MALQGCSTKFIAVQLVRPSPALLCNARPQMWFADMPSRAIQHRRLFSSPDMIRLPEGEDLNLHFFCSTGTDSSGNLPVSSKLAVA